MKMIICATEYYPYGSGIANVAYNVVENIRKEGIDCVICSPTGPDIILGNRFLIKKFGIIGLLYFWIKVSYYFKNHKYDVAWLHNPFFLFENPFPCNIVTLHSTYRGENIHQIGNTLLVRMYKKIASKIERFCLLGMNKDTIFTGVSPTLCKEINQIGIDGSRIFCIPNGVDTTLFRPLSNKNALRGTMGIPSDEIILISVGRLTPAKQPDIMLHLFSALEKRIPNISLYIFGDGELLEATKKLSGALNLNKVKFFGNVNHKTDLPFFYGISDYYIITSKYEGSPLTLFEAMASGLPCIVSEITNFNVVIEANCGIIIDINNLKAAAQEIDKLLLIERSLLSENGRKFVQNHVDWKIITRMYFNLIKECSNKML